MKSSRKIDIIKLKFGSSQKHVFTAYFDARKKKEYLQNDGLIRVNLKATSLKTEKSRGGAS